MAGELGVRRKRRAENRHFRLKKPVWQDPYPFIPGTEPEKRLFEALMRRHIYFIFQGEIPELTVGARQRLKRQLDAVKKKISDLEAKVLRAGRVESSDTKAYRRLATLRAELAAEQAKLDALLRKDKAGIFLFDPAFKPDFVIPEYRVILDPFGVYHHSLPDAVKRDAIKSVVYRALGYEFVHPWWDDKGFLLENDGHFERVGFDALAVLDTVQAFKRPPVEKLTDPLDIEAKRSTGYRIGKNIGAGANSVAIANTKRKRSHALTLRAPGRRRRVRRSL